MSFIWPALLRLLFIIPFLILLYLLVLQKRKLSLSNTGFVLSGSDDFKRRVIPFIFFMSGIGVLIFSLSRPQASVSLPKYEGTVVLVMDVSGSMSADDIEPTRMEAAKRIAADFVEEQPGGVRVGIVSFSDGGISVQKPASNRTDTLAAIERLVPRRGTSLGNGILVALNTIVVEAGDPPIIDNNQLDARQNIPSEPQGWYPSAAIVVFSDGENNDPPDPLMITDVAIDLGVRIYTIGVGSTEGALITVEGMNVFTQLNPLLLQEIADTSGGQFYFGSDPNDLIQIYDDLEPTLSIKAEELELTSLFAGVGAMLFVFGAMVSLMWFGRAV